jgi:cytidylate kinase
VLDVFIHAGRDIRVKNTMEQFGLSERKAVGLLRRTDRARKAYYKNYTGADWNDPNAYHLVVNSDRLEYEKCVDLICKAYQGV